MNKSSMNLVIIVGRVGQKPEVRYTPSQVAITTISVATTEKIKDNETTEWHSVTVFGKSAEFVSQYIDKGDMIAVSGRIETRSWDDKDGVKHYKTGIVADTVTPLSSGKQQSQPTSVSVDDEPLPF